MNFCSDNTAGVSPEIMEAITKAAQGDMMPYGTDPISVEVEKLFNDFFECETTVFFVPTGTAANALALSALSPSYGSIYCHRDAHINNSECGAPEFYTNGAKLVTLPGQNGKLHHGELEAALSATSDSVHKNQPAALSLTQASEAGTVYGPSEIHHLCEVARQFGLYVHMDGARFSNALATLTCSASDITWKAGVDVLCFGATKNGAMAGEAVVFFNKDLAREVGFKRKRGGLLFSKMRFAAAQWQAFLTDDLWLKNATHANAMAQRLKDGLLNVTGAEIYYPVEANEIFISLPEPVLGRLENAGFSFYRWHDEVSPLVRLVTSFNTDPKDVEKFIETALG